MDAMSDQSAQDRELREALRAKMQFLHSASDRKHAGGLVAWYGEFTPKQRGFARVLLERAEASARSGRGQVAQTGDLWEAEVPRAKLYPYVKSLVAQDKLIEAIKAYQADTGAGLREAKDACEAYREALRRGDERAETSASAPPAAPRQDVTVSGADLEAALAKLLAPALTGVQNELKNEIARKQAAFESGAVKVIAEHVLAAALRELEARKPREVIIQVEREGTLRTVQGLKHFQLEQALAAVTAEVPLMLVGPAGSGKTNAGEQIANVLGLTFYVQGAASGTHEYLGYKDGAGTYHSTPYRAAFEFGGLFMAEELDSGSADVPLILNAGLANGYQTFPDKAEPVRKHKDFRIIANANTYGNGADRVYVGRTQLDGATIDRFAFIDWRYDEKLELEIAGNREWTLRVQKIRAAVSAEKARLIVSPRASILGGKLLAAGLEKGLVENMVIWKGTTDEQRKRIEERLR